MALGRTKLSRMAPGQTYFHKWPRKDAIPNRALEGKDATPNCALRCCCGPHLSETAPHLSYGVHLSANEVAPRARYEVAAL